MLQIKDIRKQYTTGDLVQTALDGVSLNLRDNEFVAILGPSGSGKTTLLNVIGGLDRYDSGDLIINGISTKKYSDRDWDSYRNHTIGFVFQSYNLIPHQTVLANVELALTISGISKKERRKRAVKALEDVGLGNQLHKKPNQMSGGQMQRVAIARALVNNPNILLADEPTGALDSETSVQIMDLLKDVAKDRLVVMVTHNPELAEEYANRIVRVKDGKIIGDTNPFELAADALQPAKHKNMGRSSMSFWTALSLSANNLRTKKARTFLTAFAGSIGIIGIALILSLSTGFQRYIDKIQEDTLSNYPLSIQSETADMGSAMMAMGVSMMEAQNADDGTVIEQQMITQMFAQIGANDLGSFKTYLEENIDQVDETINTIKYSYGVKPLIFSADTSDGVLQVNPGTLFGEMMGSSALSAYMDTDIFSEMIDHVDMLDAQYEVLRGRWPENYDEMVMVLSDPHQITDYMAYTLGLRDIETLDQMMHLVMEGKEPGDPGESLKWTYEDLMALRFRLVNASDKYKYNSEYGVWEDMSEDESYMRDLVESGEELKIVGIVCPKEGASTTTLSPGIGYTAALTRHVIAQAENAQIVKRQLADESIDVFTGKPFGSKDESQMNFEDMISVDGDMLSSAFGMNVNESAIVDLIKDYIEDATESITEDAGPAKEAFVDTLAIMGRSMLNQFVAAKADPATGAAKLSLQDAESMAKAYLATEEAAALLAPMTKKYSVEADAFKRVYEPLLIGMVTSFVVTEMETPEVESPEVPDVTLPQPPETTEPSIEETAPIPMETAPVVEETSSIPVETEPVLEETAPVPMETEPELPKTLPLATPMMGVRITLTAAEETANEGATIDPEQFYAYITADQVETLVKNYTESALVEGTAGIMAGKMTEVIAQKKLMAKLSGFGNRLMKMMGNAMTVDESKIEGAFQFNMNEQELRRLMEAMSGNQKESSSASNLKSLGYANLEEPASMSIYLVDFAGKEQFMDFLDDYNVKMEKAGQEEQVINYTDVTGIMMSSVRTIIDSVSYVLIAFVAVSLVVSSIMIGIITYISVMERTKEIGVLRAIGASKRNISQVFNAETFIIGLISGALGIIVTLILIVPINEIIHNVTGNLEINAQLPSQGAVVLVILSVVLTLIGGLIPSKQAAKKDPVIALRSE
mgnify:CR=1 FL=1